MRAPRRRTQVLWGHPHVLRVHGRGILEGHVPHHHSRQSREARVLSARPRRGAEPRRSGCGQELVRIPLPSQPPRRQPFAHARRRAEPPTSLACIFFWPWLHASFVLGTRAPGCGLRAPSLLLSILPLPPLPPSRNLDRTHIHARARARGRNAPAKPQAADEPARCLPRRGTTGTARRRTSATSSLRAASAMGGAL